MQAAAGGAAGGAAVAAAAKVIAVDSDCNLHFVFAAGSERIHSCLFLLLVVQVVVAVVRAGDVAVGSARIHAVGYCCCHCCCCCCCCYLLSIKV